MQKMNDVNEKDMVFCKDCKNLTMKGIFTKVASCHTPNDVIYAFHPIEGKVRQEVQYDGPTDPMVLNAGFNCSNYNPITVG